MVAASRTQHAYALGAALLCWFALALQFYLSIRQSIANGRDIVYGVWMYLAFFTILTNLLVAIVLSAPLIAPESRVGRFCRHSGTIAGVAVNIALVGIAYNLLLRNVWHPHGLQLVGDVLLHDAVPLIFIGYSWMSAGIAVASFAARALWGAWPVIYFAYALARGAVTGFYPYPFIHVGHLGYLQVLVNAVGLLLGYLLIAASLHGFERAIFRKPATYSTQER